MKTFIRFLLLFFAFCFSQVSKGEIIVYYTVEVAHDNHFINKNEFTNNCMTIFGEGYKIMKGEEGAPGVDTFTYLEDGKPYYYVCLEYNSMKVKFSKELVKSSDLKVTYTDSSAYIAGYNCKRALISDGNSDYEVFYTEDFDVNLSSIMGVNHPGIALRYEVANEHFGKLIFTAYKVEATSQNLEHFKPANYQLQFEPKVNNKWLDKQLPKIKFRSEYGDKSIVGTSSKVTVLVIEPDECISCTSSDVYLHKIFHRYKNQTNIQWVYLSSYLNDVDIPDGFIVGKSQWAADKLDISNIEYFIIDQQNKVVFHDGKHTYTISEMAHVLDRLLE